MASVEQDFREFRRRGDTGALARVFDALAPELLLLAAHLTRDQARAEDVVQDTFLQAIESADQYKGEGRLRSWLAGILVRKARKARRSEGRQPDPDRLDGAVDVSPADEAEARELVESLSHALQSLPTRYRQVLNLRLVHGFSAVEISRTLERPPATVHTQLRRGLEMLRQSLPRGLALPAVMILQGRGLAMVRKLVLERAGTTAAVGGAVALAIGGSVMLKKLVVVGLLGSVALLGYWQLSPTSAGALPLTQVSQLSAMESLQVGEEASDRRQDARVERELLEQTGNEKAALPGETVIKGRVVAPETGLPLAGGRVRLRGRARDEQNPVDRQEWHDPERITTGPDGLFEFRVEPPSEFRFTLDASAENRAEMRAEWGKLSRGTVVDVGDIPMFVGARLSGRVVDEKGEVVPGVNVVLNRAEGELYSDLLTVRFFTMFLGESAEDGTFASRQLLLPGDWELKTYERGPALVSPPTFSVAERQESVHLEVIVRRLTDLPTLSGIVVDRTGRPVEGVELYTLRGWLPSPRNTGVSGPDGRFTIHRQSGVDGGVQIRQMPTNDLVLVPDETLYEWGTSGIRLVVRRPAALTITVAEADTGKPVEDFGVRLYSVSGGNRGPESEIRWREPHEDGVLTVPGVRVGHYVAIVFPEDEGLLPGRTAFFEMGEHGVSLPIELHRPLPMTVRVITGDGTPVFGSTVELIRMEGEGEITMHTRSGTPQEAYSKWAYESSTGDVPALAIVVDRGVTDEHGEVVLEGPESRGGLAVKALGPGHTPVLRTGVSLGADSAPLTVRVSVGASLRGAIRPARLVEIMDQTHVARAQARRMTAEGAEEFLRAYRPTVSLRSASGERFPEHTSSRRSGWVLVEPDGSFLVEGIPPGSWTLFLRSFLPAQEGTINGNFIEWRVASIPNLGDGETRSLDVDASALMPGTLSARVFLNGEPLVDTDLRLVRHGVDDNTRKWGGEVQLRTDGGGRFVRQAWPGFYTVALPQVPDAPSNGVPIESVEEIEVVAGQTAEQTFALTRSTLRVRFLESDGSPATERYFQMANGLDQWQWRARGDAKTDAEGWLVVDPAPREPVTFVTFPKGLDSGQLRQHSRTEQEAMQIRLGPVQVPAGQRQAEVTLHLPAGR